MKALILTIFFLSFAVQAGAGTLPYFTQSDFTPVWKDTRSPQTALAKMPTFHMKTQKAKSVTDGNFVGKITVVNFFYASCGGICPMLMEKLKKVNAELSPVQDVEMLSFTITPNLDTPEKLSAYAQKRKITLNRWSLLTGSDVEIRNVEKAFKADKDVPSKQAGETVHSENIYLLDRDSKIRGIYNASSAADLQLLVQDAKSL